MNVPAKNQTRKSKAMNQNPENDPIFSEAIKNFRSSVHTWSEHELTRRPASASDAQPSRWSWLMAPAVSWTAAAALLVAGAGVPLSIHFHHPAQPMVAGKTLDVTQHASPASTPQTEAKADDDQLLEHVDTDIAQDTPDAMQPLASLMSTSGND